MNEAQTIQRMADFLESIGIPVVDGEVPEGTFLPGILIDNGRLVVDRANLRYPGDLLHEAGHIAVMEPDRRSGVSGYAGYNPGDEIAAICWSYAAARALEIDTNVLFHEHGYKGEGPWLVETFENGQYVGLPLLEWMGFTLSDERAAEQGAEPYPHMLRWLRG